MVFGPLFLLGVSLLSWLLWLFDSITGVKLIREGKLASFLQATRSKNILSIVFLLISGREVSDCVFLAGLAFFIPAYITSAPIRETKDFYLSVCVFFEFYFEKKCGEIAARIPPFGISLLTLGIRLWLVWILNEEIFNRSFKMPG